MKKQHELELMRIILDSDGRIPDSLIDVLTKIQYAVLRKWADREYWEYGVSLRTGWITSEGESAFKEYLER